MRPPRLIALDIDGTTVHEHRPPSPRVLTAVRAVAGRAHVVLCTGRTVLGIGHVLDQLAVPTEATVCSNGAVVLDSARAVVRRSEMDPAPVVAALGAVLPDGVFGCEETGVGQRVSGDFLGVHLAGRVRTVSPAELVATRTPKVIGYLVGATPEEVEERMSGVTVPGVELTLDHELPWVTAVPEGVTKASALAAVAAELGVARADVLAVGDGDNDRAMLRWAGTGVAMGQAPDAVKADADEVTARVEDDGLALVLERLG